MKAISRKPLDVELLWRAFCDTIGSCKNCPVAPFFNKSTYESCKEFCKKEPEKVAELMDFILFDEETQEYLLEIRNKSQQTLAHKEGDTWVLNDLPPVLSKQKSPAEWTLQEVKDYCEQTNCLNCCFNPTNKWRGCTFLEQKYKASGHIVTNKPARWNLKPHWTEQDIEDAKAVQRIFPQIKYIEKNYNILDQIIKQDTLILGETAGFPSIKNRQTIAIAEILADGQNSVDGHNEED